MAIIQLLLYPTLFIVSFISWRRIMDSGDRNHERVFSAAYFTERISFWGMVIFGLITICGAIFILGDLF